MQIRDKHIEIVVSKKPGLSSMSSASREAILAILSKHYAHVVITVVDTVADIQGVVDRKPDLVFLGMKFIPKDPSLGFVDSNKIWISQYLEDSGITHTGSSFAAVKLELNKQLAKERLQSDGLPTARFQFIKRNKAVTITTIPLTYPLFIKPANMGSGTGVDDTSLATDFEQASYKIATLALQFDSDILVEEYLPGREFSVGILRQPNTAEYDVMPVEIIAPENEAGARFLSSDVKLGFKGDYPTIAVPEPVLDIQLSALALSAFKSIGARDYGRIDIRLDREGNPHFLEANLVPSLLDNFGNFPKMCKEQIDLGHEQLILRLVELVSCRATPELPFTNTLDFVPSAPLLGNPVYIAN